MFNKVSNTYDTFSLASLSSTLDMSPQISLTEPPETIRIEPLSPIEDVKLFISPQVPFASKDTIIPPMKVDATIVRQPIITTDILGRPHVMIAEDIFIPSVQYVSSNPLVLPYIVGDSCNIENIKEDLSHLYYYKLLDKWLYEDNKSKSVLKYLHIADGKVRLISNVEKTDDVSKNTQEIIDKKVEYIENNVLSQDEIVKILVRFVESTRISWCELSEHGFLVREAITKTLKNKLRRLVEQQ